MIPAAALALVAVAGLALGSFAVTGGQRLARGASAMAGRSRCDGCGRALSFAATMPVVSYVWRAGACEACGGRIDPLHPLGEIAGALVALSALAVAGPLRGSVLAAEGLLLIAAAAADWRARRLPDLLTAPIATTGLILAGLEGRASVMAGVLAAGLVALMFLGLRRFGPRQGGQPGLGLGDVKFAAALALWLGPATPMFIAAASVGGLLLMAAARPADGRLPFGPPLALAAWIVGLSQEAGLWPTMM